MIWHTVSLLVLLGITAGKFRKVGGLQQWACGVLILIMLTMLSVVKWDAGRPSIDATGTRERIIQNLTKGESNGTGSTTTEN